MNRIEKKKRWKKSQIKNWTRPTATDHSTGLKSPQQQLGLVRPQPAAAERAATTTTTQQPPTDDGRPESGCRRRRGAAFLALFPVGGPCARSYGCGAGAGLVRRRIVSFSLEILAPPRLPVAVSVVSFSVLLLRWARSVPSGDVIGRVIHSRRFEEFEGRWGWTWCDWGGSGRAHVDLDHHLAFAGRWCGRRRRTRVRVVGGRRSYITVLFRFGRRRPRDSDLA